MVLSLAERRIMMLRELSEKWAATLSTHHSHAMHVIGFLLTYEWINDLIYVRSMPLMLPK